MAGMPYIGQAAWGAVLILVLLLSVGHPSEGRAMLMSRASGRATGRQLLASSTSSPTTLDLTAPATPATAGTTPDIIGVNLGHRYPGSNWPLWLRRLGVNGARVFLSALWGSSLESFVGGSTKWGKSLSGTPVTNLTTWQAAVAELRTPAGHDPASAALWAYPVHWATFDNKWVTTDTSSPASEQEGNHNATLATLAQVLPNTPVVVIGCGLSSIRDGTVLDNTTAAYWASHWEVYKHFYAFARYLWLRNISRIELYNEPDLDTNFALGTGLNAPLWLDTYKLRSRAIQDLYTDLNAAASTALGPKVHVGAYAKTQYNEGKLGQPAVQAMHGTFATGVDPNPAWFNMHAYSYHSYGQAGASILANFQQLLANTTTDRAAVGPFPFAVTEYNAKTSGDFSTSTLNMDVASQAAKLGSQTINYATAGVDLTSLYVFKFSVTLSSSNGVTKNGIHWGDNIAAPYAVADTTLGAEALRLVAERAAGAKPILSLTSAMAAKLVDTKALAVRDGLTGAYYVHLVNTGTSSVRAALGMAAWGIKAGQPVIVERVNATHYGEVSEVLAANSTGGVFVTLPPDNLVRVTVPATATAAQAVAATAGVQVRAGGLSNTNYASSPRMCVGSHPTSHNMTQASIMKFTVTNPGAVTAAVLQLTLSTLSASLTDNMPMLLLGLGDSSWTPSTVTWNSLAGAGAGPLLVHPPAGSTSSWALDAVAKNFVNYAAPGLQVVGHVTLPPLAATAAPGYVKMVDVTQFVRAGGSGTVSFLLVRPLRRNTEVATGDTMLADTLNGGTYACWSSVAATTASTRPTLLVYN